MSRLTATGVLATLSGVPVCVAYLGESTRPVARASQKGEPAFTSDVREIDLSAIYSTSGQKKLEPVIRHLEEKSPERKALESIDDVLRESRSPPLVAIVRGENIKAAVLATERFVQSKPRPVRPVGPDDKSTSKKCWLFVHVAHDSSSPIRWLIYPPTVFGKKVRVSYAHFAGWFSDEPVDTVTADDHPYHYWMPLGTFENTDDLRAELVELTKTVKVSYPARRKN